MLMADGHQHVERAVAGRRHRVVGAAGVLDVERRVFGQHVPVLDVVEVLPVIPRDVDVVVLELVAAALDAEVEHEGRAGEALAGDGRVGPPAAQPVRHQRRHGVAEVGVDDHGVGAQFAVGGAHADGAPALEQDFLDRLVQADGRRPARWRRAPCRA